VIKIKITIKLATVDEKEILVNLMEKYEYESSQYTGAKINELGIYGCYDWLDDFWQDETSWPYLIRVDDRLAGFALVGDFPIEGQQTDFIIDEFFIIYNYRKQGVGKFVINHLLDQHKGRWGVIYTPKNLPATQFWRKVISEYTNDNYEMVENYARVSYNDDTLGTVLLFES